MWEVNSLFAADDNGNYVTLKNNRVTLSVRDAKNKLVYRNFSIKETPPCLIIAVNDLINLLAKEGDT